MSRKGLSERACLENGLPSGSLADSSRLRFLDVRSADMIERCYRAVRCRQIREICSIRGLGDRQRQQSGVCQRRGRMRTKWSVRGKRSL